MSKDESKIILISLLAVVVIAVGTIIVVVLNNRAAENNTESVIEESIREEQSAAAEYAGDPKGDDEPHFETIKGENGGEDVVNAHYDGFNPGNGAGTKDLLVNLAIHYNKSVPYLINGYDESLVHGYVTGQAIDNYNLGKKAHGMTNQSYIVWLFRNTFGSTPQALDDFQNVYKSGKKVTSGELKIGDIGMYYSNGDDNLYGVCVGFFNGHPIFTYCANVPTKEFPAGCNHIAYLLSDTEAYFNGSAPVDFRYFVRLPLSWKEASK